ncbi:MAG: hypothetical protein PHX43_01550 [Alphaproteobacteria bacterium]|nr:hypothetical protein [Alphaproteobacteria bacterium]
MTKQTVSILSACLIALLSVDIAIPIIDIFSVPLPRYFYGISFSMVFGFAELFMLWPFMQQSKVKLWEIGVVSALLILIIWGGLEGLQKTLGKTADPDFIGAFLPLVFTACLARIHCRVFGNAYSLIDAFVNTSVLLASFHLFVMFVIYVDISMPIVNMNELYHKNGISLFVTVAVWIKGVIDKRRCALISYGFLVPLLVAIIHTASNQSRAGCIVLVLTLAMTFLNRRISKSYRPTEVFIGLSLIVVALVSLSYPIIDWLNLSHLFGDGDGQISAQSRSLSNFMLVEQIIKNPFFGIGGYEVVQMKAYGYMSHTLYLIIVAAYGLMGLVPLLIMLGMWLKISDGNERVLISMFILLIVLMTSFFNDAFAFYGLLLVLVNEANYEKVGRYT